MNGDEYVTGTELGMYLTEKVLGYATYQTPQYGKIRDPDLDEGDFVFQITPPVQQRAAVEDTQSFYAKGEQLYKEKKYQEALGWYRKAADAGNAPAQACIGYMYENGYGVRKNYKKTLLWYKKAAAQGNTYAIEALERLQ